MQNVKEDREGFYLCQAKNGIGLGIGKVIQLKVNCESNYFQELFAQHSNYSVSITTSEVAFLGVVVDGVRSG